MRNKRWILLSLFATIGGCASMKSAQYGRSTAVPVQPIAEGRAVNLSSYDVAIDGVGCGRVLFGAGAAVDELRHDVVHIGMRVENQSADHALYLPTDQLLLQAFGPSAITPFEIDDGATPEKLVIEPGQAKSFDLAFALPPGARIDDVHAFDLRWSIVTADGARLTRTTTFAANERARSYGPLVDASGRRVRWSDLPASHNADRSSMRREQHDVSWEQNHAMPGTGPRMRTEMPSTF